MNIPQQVKSVIKPVSILAILALTFAVLVEIEKHHPQHIVYSLLLLILLVALIYINRTFIFPDLLII